MAIDVNKYLDCRNPKKPLELFPEGVLQRLVDGFCFYLRAGVSILYPKMESPDPALCASDPDSQFDRLEPSRGREWYHPFCAEFRDCDFNDKQCREFDAEVAAKYWADTQRPPEMYECHMGLIEMNYRLRLGRRIAAVVFAGQLISQDQVSTISQRINERAEASTRNALHNHLRVVTKAVPPTSEEVRWTFGNFVEFGNMLQGLLDKLYAQQWEAAKRRFLNEVVRELTPEPLREEWRVTLNNVLQDFLQLMGLGGLEVYRRRQSRFDLWGKAPRGDGSAEESIPARLVAVVPDSLLTPLEKLRDYGLAREDLERIARGLALGQRNVRLFAFRHQEQPTPPTDVLVAISGTVAEEDNDFIRDFCETVALRVQIASLVVTLQDERADFAERVGHVGHAAKTPLQTVVQLLESLDERVSPPGHSRRVTDECLRRIKIAKAYIREIYTPPSRKGRRIELMGLLHEVVNETDELIKRRECLIKTDMGGLYNPSVLDEGNLRIAFTNLLDNATKYSNPGRVVTIRVKDWGHTALVEIENLGQGIPLSHIETVCRGHSRWVPPNLQDSLRRRRDGEGVGLAMAIQYVENHGGWVEIYSVPEEERYREDPRDHWRTRVTVGLPVVRQQ